ncbi:MAG: DUF763 domain-containing protein [Gemmatimonadota bacterium]
MAARRSGSADLPLHRGKAPRWLFERMERLAPAVIEAVVLEHGPAEVLARLSDPWWFQAFGCLLGFDWHSSGVTTTVCGALKSGLAGREADIGIWVAGGKGKASRKTPDELVRIGDRTGLDADRLVYNSRLSAKVDSAAVQDGFGIYHHSFFVTRDGEWAVVQQGMRPDDRSARRYHWLGTHVADMVREPHAAIASQHTGGRVLDLTAAASDRAREATTALARDDPGDRLPAPGVHGVERTAVGGGGAGGGSPSGRGRSGGVVGHPGRPRRGPRPGDLRPGWRPERRRWAGPP